MDATLAQQIPSQTLKESIVLMHKLVLSVSLMKSIMVMDHVKNVPKIVHQIMKKQDVLCIIKHHPNRHVSTIRSSVKEVSVLIVVQILTQTATRHPAWATHHTHPSLQDQQHHFQEEYQATKPWHQANSRTTSWAYRVKSNHSKMLHTLLLNLLSILNKLSLVWNSTLFTILELVST